MAGGADRTDGPGLGRPAIPYQIVTARRLTDALALFSASRADSTLDAHGRCRLEADGFGDKRQLAPI
jgi:hypothetical protein